MRPNLMLSAGVVVLIVVTALGYSFLSSDRQIRQLERGREILANQIKERQPIVDEKARHVLQLLSDSSAEMTAEVGFALDEHSRSVARYHELGNEIELARSRQPAPASPGAPR